MSSTTPNLGLTKTTAAETIGQNWAASNDSGGNFDIIDTKMGAVGNTSLQAQVDALNSNKASVSDLTNSVAIGENVTVERLAVYRIGKVVFFSFRASCSAEFDVLINNLPPARQTTGICPFAGSQLAYIAQNGIAIQAQTPLTSQNITGFYITT